jgi:GxxExxY protein
MSEFIYQEESYAIMGACFEVYKDKGCGFHEPVYHESLGIEMRLRNLPAISKPKLQLEYKGQRLETGFEPDYVCYGRIILELKTVAKLLDAHRAQVMNYLKSANMRLGLLVNFSHHPNLEWERIIANDKWQLPAENNPPDLQA